LHGVFLSEILSEQGAFLPEILGNMFYALGICMAYFDRLILEGRIWFFLIQILLTGEREFASRKSFFTFVATSENPLFF
jgi:hypothetical protein